jgi:hypothetical protein
MRHWILNHYVHSGMSPCVTLCSCQQYTHEYLNLPFTYDFIANLGICISPHINFLNGCTCCQEPTLSRGWNALFDCQILKKSIQYIIVFTVFKFQCSDSGHSSSLSRALQLLTLDLTQVTKWYFFQIKAVNDSCWARMQLLCSISYGAKLPSSDCTVCSLGDGTSRDGVKRPSGRPLCSIRR